MTAGLRRFGRTFGLLSPRRSSARARAFDIAQRQIGQAPGTWFLAVQYARPK